MRVKQVIFVESMEELEKIAEQCNFDTCACCGYFEQCIGCGSMWAYKCYIDETPVTLYCRFN